MPKSNRGGRSGGNHLSPGDKMRRDADRHNREAEREYNKQYSEEKEKIDAFLAQKGGGTLEMDGRVIEKFTKEEMITQIKDYLSDAGGYMFEDNSLSILYKDGTTKFFGPGDEFTRKNVKLSNIDSIIAENDATSQFYGKNVKIYDYSIGYRDWQKAHDSAGIAKFDYQIDWRLDFK